MFTNQDFFTHLRSKNLVFNSAVSRQSLYNVVRDKYSQSNVVITSPMEDGIRTKITVFCSHLFDRWQKANRTERVFLKNNGKWLQGNIILPNFVEAQPSSSKRKRGRPKVLFAEASTVTKKRRLKDLQEEKTCEELLFAAKTALGRKSRRSTVKLLTECTETTPLRSQRLCNIIKKAKTEPIIQYTPDEALAYFLQTNMSRDAYIETRLGAKKRNADIYPSYKKLLEAKKMCYPHGIEITSEGAKIPLESLLHKTTSRLLEIVEPPSNITKMTLICKWGCDGSSGYSQYMHKPVETTSYDPDVGDDEAEEEQEEEEEENNPGFSEQNLFLMSLVPLQLIGNQDSNPVSLWKNPHASSTQWCRPVRMLYQKETKKLTIKEVQHMNYEIANLNPYTTERWTCNYKLCLTMVNGKAISAITNVPSQNCHICGAKPSSMNILKEDYDIGNMENLQYGLTTMHAWMKFTEHVLHVSDYQNWKKPTIRGATASQRAEINERRRTTIEEIKDRLGIHIDKVVQGKGTSNTGNVGRTFLRNYKIISEITGVDEELIKRYYFIMVALSCGLPINYDNFKRYTRETAELYISKYNWYRMPVSIHKILMHGAETAKNLILPIGLMSEEAQESCNKIYRRVRERHSRKDQLLHTTEDVIHSMLVSSDPVITNIKSLRLRIKKKELPEELISLQIVDIEKVEEHSDKEDEED